ncbi:MAG: Aspartyl/glutamyl-tRNA(Asn/Gln) amidotransferase subunit B [Alphaproteobacteria bacterium MarineAlpha5_Bin9]|nr:MAG: Aspartyl/glutamyl-tRNA(Asn/Gln) amidotransferase subunit B [Alphaproteobacteria bacterium MarineAlpha5_Bin9]|tara:strand:- start:3674 stop:5140 length:1467 start_codon:yes stop_codon:yes gene_type:complete
MNNLIKGKKHKWEAVIGLEVHAQVKSKSKLFSSSSTKFGSIPNSQVSLVDAAMPGMLPVINEYCIKQAIKTGLGLNAKINKFSVFDRKNYFYADLPQGYQISQYLNPIIGNGSIFIDLNEEKTKEIRITRLHLEQDAGKSLHDQNPEKTYVDLNRSGIALMEIVSEPDMRSPEEAALFIQKLRSILMYLNTCDGNMQEGSLRADVNISIRKPGDKLGTRCEIKNLNSIKFIKQAINFEITRQIDIVEKGGVITQNTLLFDTDSGITRPMRNKEEAHDYRYFPDPDLLPLRLDDKFINEIKKEIPELPDERKKRYINDLNLSNYDSTILISNKNVSDYFDEVLINHKDLKKSAKIVVNWISSELFSILKKNNLNIINSPISPNNLGHLIKLILSETISGKIAKEIFEEMFISKTSPDKIIKDKGLKQMNNDNDLEEIIDKILKSNSDKVKEYKNGKTKLLGFFVGQVMKESKGRANPKKINQLLNKQLN